jgi:hypothetical protein
MNKFEIVKNILGTLDNDYVYGAAEVGVNYSTLADLIKNETPIVSREGAPSVSEFSEFLKKHQKREIELNLMVINPKREDFRVEVLGVTISNEDAKLNNEEDYVFWKDFMTLAQTGSAYMEETDVTVSLKWENE